MQKHPSWRGTEKDLTRWMIRELSSIYFIPERFSRAWIDQNQITPLLDGFDEVRADLRTSCLQAVNDFRQSHPQTKIVVCSRIDEYLEAIETKGEGYRLQLNSAIELQALTQQQIDDYLTIAGPSLATLQTVIQEDDILLELAQSPLMLNIMIVAYEDLPAADLRGFNSVEARRHHLFDLYVARAFNPIGKPKPSLLYPIDQTKQWLTWLAKRLHWHNESIFLLERMQPSWLVQPKSLWFYSISSRAILGASGGMIGGMIIILAHVINSAQVQPDNTSLNYILGVLQRVDLWRGILEGTFGGLMGGISLGVIDAVEFLRRHRQQAYDMPLTLATSIRNAVWVGLTTWLFVALTLGMLLGTLDSLDWIKWFRCYGDEATSPVVVNTWWRCVVGYLSEGLLVGLLVSISFITLLRASENRQDPKLDIRTTDYLHWLPDGALRGGLYGLGRGVALGVIVIIFDQLGLLMGVPYRGSFGIRVKTGNSIEENIIMLRKFGLLAALKTHFQTCFGSNTQRNKTYRYFLCCVFP